MSGLKAPILAVKNQLKTLTVLNGDGQSVTPFVKVWNTQVKKEMDAKTYDFPKPAYFIEVRNDVIFEQAGIGYRSADLLFRIHIVQDWLDAGNETDMDEDLAIYDLRDQVNGVLSMFRPTGCTELQGTADIQDFNHEKVYEYVLEYICNFMDDTMSPYRPGAGVYEPSPAPLGLELDATIDNTTPGPVFQRDFSIPKQPLK